MLFRENIDKILYLIDEIEAEVSFLINKKRIGSSGESIWLNYLFYIFAINNLSHRKAQTFMYNVTWTKTNFVYKFTKDMYC